MLAGSLSVSPPSGLAGPQAIAIGISLAAPPAIAFAAVYFVAFAVFTVRNVSFYESAR